MPSQTTCPKCNGENIYEDSNLWMCPDCSHEWIPAIATAGSVTEDTSIRDAFGNMLITGDTVTVVKELKIKGTSSVVKVGTKVKNIRLVESDDGHNIACKIDGLGAIHLKSEFVKKA